MRNTDDPATGISGRKRTSLTINSSGKESTMHPVKAIARETKKSEINHLAYKSAMSVASSVESMVTSTPTKSVLYSVYL